MLKKIFIFSFVVLLLVSCGTKGTGNPEIDTIGIGTAFSIVAKTFSYWIFILFSLMPMAFYLYLFLKRKIDQVDLRVLFGLLAVIFIAIFLRPCEIAANTSIAAFERGNIIGY